MRQVPTKVQNRTAKPLLSWGVRCQGSFLEEVRLGSGGGGRTRQEGRPEHSRQCKSLRPCSGWEQGWGGCAWSCHRTDGRVIREDVSRAVRLWRSGKNAGRIGKERKAVPC